MLTGDPINACDAKNYGIVDALSDDDKLLKNALIFSKKIINKSFRRLSELTSPKTNVSALEKLKKTSYL